MDRVKVEEAIHINVQDRNKIDNVMFEIKKQVWDSPEIDKDQLLKIFEGEEVPILEANKILGI